MISSPEAVANENDAGVNEKSHQNPGRDDLRVWVFVLVQVPRSSHAKELSLVSCSIQDQDYEVDNLKRLTGMRVP